MSAKFARILLTALSISALILAGCNSDDEDTSPTGPTGNTGATINAGNIATVQAALTTTFTRALAQGLGTHNGAKSGTVKITLSTGKPAQLPGSSIKYNAVFDNYSDDGQLFHDGNLLMTVNPTTTTSDAKYTGDITLSGTYNAKIKINVTTTNGVTSGTYTVDGHEFPVSG